MKEKERKYSADLSKEIKQRLRVEQEMETNALFLGTFQIFIVEVCRFG